MALATKNELVTAIQRVINRNDISDAVDEWIVMFEKNMEQFLRRREMSQRATTDTVASQQGYAMPGDFGDAIGLYMTVEGRKKELKAATWSHVATAYAETGEPEEWSIVQNEFVLGPIPDKAYALELHYYKGIPSLLDNSTNWLLLSYPNVYVYGVLINSVAFVDMEHQNKWSMAYANALSDLKRDQIRERGFGGGPILRTDGLMWMGSSNILTDE